MTQEQANDLCKEIREETAKLLNAESLLGEYEEPMQFMRNVARSSAQIHDTLFILKALFQISTEPKLRESIVEVINAFASLIVTIRITNEGKTLLKTQ